MVPRPPRPGQKIACYNPAMSQSPPPAFSFSRLAGAALGAMCGDALGMPVEGWSAARIEQAHGRLDAMLPGRLPAGSYTDDSQMMIAILQTLAQQGGLDPAYLAQRFLALYEPRRGYGGRIDALMSRLAAGEPWDRVGTDSFGNGSAMRVAPIGFYYYDDPAELTRAAVGQASITHRHPEALAGAVMQAGAVALALKSGLEKKPVQMEDFLSTLADLAAGYDENSARRLLGLTRVRPGPLADLVPRIRSLFRCNVKAVEAVPPAIASFLLTQDFRQAVVLAVNLGGDTDTLGAMAGATAGAYYGRTGLPEEWVGVLENGPRGRDYVVDLCRRAAKNKVEAMDQDRG